MVALALAVACVQGSAVAFDLDAHEAMALKAVEEHRASALSRLLDLGPSVSAQVMRSDISSGCVAEDEYRGPLSVRSHFHDPLSNRGFWDLSEDPSVAPSSLSWAQAPSGAQDFSWLAATDALHRALTAPAQQERNDGYRASFTALGHVIHLVQDLASPFHVRNDSHIHWEPFPGIGGLIEHAPDHAYVDPTVVETLGKVAPPASLLGTPSRTGMPSSISNLWDTDTYSSDSACADIVGDVGLAELSAAHATSSDSVPQDGSTSFPCPTVGHEALKACYESFGTTYCDFGAVAGLDYTLAVSARSWFGRTRYFYDWASARVSADHFVPLGVGYSEALFEHLFRGVMRQDGAPAIGARATSDGRLEITNRSGVGLGPGEWRQCRDFKGQGRRCSTLGTQPLSNGESLVVPMPALDPDGKLILVYRGQVGHDLDGVAARICECRDGRDVGEYPCDGVCPADCSIQVDGGGSDLQNGGNGPLHDVVLRATAGAGFGEGGFCLPPVDDQARGEQAEIYQPGTVGPVTSFIQGEVLPPRYAGLPCAEGSHASASANASLSVDTPGECELDIAFSGAASSFETFWPYFGYYNERSGAFAGSSASATVTPLVHVPKGKAIVFDVEEGTVVLDRMAAMCGGSLFLQSPPGTFNYSKQVWLDGVTLTGPTRLTFVRPWWCGFGEPYWVAFDVGFGVFANSQAHHEREWSPPLVNSNSENAHLRIRLGTW